MSTITIDIKGRDWKFILVPDRRYDKLYNDSEEHGSAAITLPTIREVHFRKSDWDLITIRHELLHVLYNMSLVSSTDMSIEDVQELCAEIVGHHAIEIVLWADQIAERFLGRQ
jgi:hypothetical protein